MCDLGTKDVCGMSLCLCNCVQMLQMMYNGLCACEDSIDSSTVYQSVHQFWEVLGLLSSSSSLLFSNCGVSAGFTRFAMILRSLCVLIVQRCARLCQDAIDTRWWQKVASSAPPQKNIAFIVKVWRCLLRPAQSAVVGGCSLLQLGTTKNIKGKTKSTTAEQCSPKSYIRFPC